VLRNVNEDANCGMKEEKKKLKTHKSDSTQMRKEFWPDDKKTFVHDEISFSNWKCF
jgi:hypothetical protein